MLSGCRVLLVEDEPLVAEHITTVLTEAEADVVGPIPTVAEARQLIRKGLRVGAAVLDINLPARRAGHSAAGGADRARDTDYGLHRRRASGTRASPSSGGGRAD